MLLGTTTKGQNRIPKIGAFGGGGCGAVGVGVIQPIFPPAFRPQSSPSVPVTEGMSPYFITTRCFLAPSAFFNVFKSDCIKITDVKVLIASKIPFL